MKTEALEKTNKAKRIAEAILGYLEEWTHGLSKEQGLQSDHPNKKYYGDKIDLDAIEPEDYNELVEEFMKIIEKEL